ncbi:MAG: ABC transporter ATP-binding protein [Spirochaetales bacterium]|nr:ABC transporter ATP-binding protein [Spirochaetales bacterium]
MDEIIRIKDLCGGYAENQVIKNLSLDISKGGFTAIAGPNGAGKSTLLKYLIKELGCPESTVFIENRDIRQISQLEIARLVSFQGQYVPKSEEFTVREAVALGRFSYGDVDRNTEEVEKALKLCRIEGLADKYVTRISGGEFQLAMLARTICQNSDILALDEPINNLDPRHQIMLMDLLKDLSNKGKTVLCVMHDLNAILRSCDKCIILKDGTIFSYGETKSVLTEENIKTVYGIDVQIIVHQGKSVILFK